MSCAYGLFTLLCRGANSRCCVSASCTKHSVLPKKPGKNDIYQDVQGKVSLHARGEDTDCQDSGAYTPALSEGLEKYEIFQYSGLPALTASRKMPAPIGTAGQCGKEFELIPIRE